MCVPVRAQDAQARQLRGEINGLEAESQKRLFNIEKMKKQLQLVSGTHEGAADTALCTALTSSLMPCPKPACPYRRLLLKPLLLYYV